MNSLIKLYFLLVILVISVGCSPDSPNKPGPGPKPPMVHEL